jgi:hypothetical protein
LIVIIFSSSSTYYPHLNDSGGTDLTASSSPCMRRQRLLHPSSVTARRCWADPCDCVWKYFFYICLGIHSIPRPHPQTIAVRGASGAWLPRQRVTPYPCRQCIMRRRAGDILDVRSSCRGSVGR